MRTVTQTSTDPIEWDYHSGPDPMEGQRLFRVIFDGVASEGVALVFAKNETEAAELVRHQMESEEINPNQSLTIISVNPKPNEIFYFNNGNY